MSEGFVVSWSLVKRVLKVLVVIAIVFGGYKSYAFAQDYKRVSQQNLLMWSYLTQALEMSNGEKPSRAQLMDVVLKERFSAPAAEKEEPPKDPRYEPRPPEKK